MGVGVGVGLLEREREYVGESQSIIWRRLFSCKSRTFLILSVCLSVCFSFQLFYSSSFFIFMPFTRLTSCFYCLFVYFFDSQLSYLSFYLPLAAVLVNTCLLILSFSLMFSEFFRSLTCWTQVSTYLETRNLIWTQWHWKKSWQ